MKSNCITKILGTRSLSSAKHIPGNEVVAISRSAELMVRINLMIIEAYDIHPPETGTPKRRDDKNLFQDDPGRYLSGRNEKNGKDKIRHQPVYFVLGEGNYYKNK
jgi:hypothetical protein